MSEFMGLIFGSYEAKVSNLRKKLEKETYHGVHYKFFI